MVEGLPGDGRVARDGETGGRWKCASRALIVSAAQQRGFHPWSLRRTQAYLKVAWREISPEARSLVVCQNVGELATAHEEWDERWKDAGSRAAWLEPEPLVLALAERLRERGLSRVLDLGCGVGRHAHYLAAKGSSASASTRVNRGLPTRASTPRRPGSASTIAWARSTSCRSRTAASTR